MKNFFSIFAPKKFKISTPEYVDRHLGRNFIILGGGPTVKASFKEIINLQKKYNAIVIGTNKPFEKIQSDYQLFTNRKRWREFGTELETSTKVLLGVHLPRKEIELSDQYELAMYVNSDDIFDIKDGVITANCRTTAVLAIAISIVMGADRIFIAGLDGYSNLIRNKTDVHFYRNDDTPKTSEALDMHYDYLLDVEKKNAFYLKQIQEYLLKENKKTFKIVTETVFSDFFHPLKAIL